MDSTTPSPPSGSGSHAQSLSLPASPSQEAPPSPPLPRGAAQVLLSQFLSMHSFGLPRARHSRSNADQEAQIARFIAELPRLCKGDVGDDDACPICLVPFAEIFEVEGKGKERERSPVQSPGRRRAYGGDFVSGTELMRGEREQEDVDREGVTQLPGCGHVFCRHDLVEWITNLHGSCPTCRRTYLDIRPGTDTDDESSDGGEYVPRDEDDEDSVIVDTDGFSEVDDAPDWADTSAGAWGADESGEWEDHGVVEDHILMEHDVDPAFAVDVAEVEGDAEMTDGEDNVDWGLTDGSSDVMTSDDAEMASASDVEDGVSVIFDMDGYSSSADEDYIPPEEEK